MTERYYCPTPVTGSEAVLAGPEAHHLIHVMRLKAGSQVVLFDGSGHEFPAEVRAVERDRVRLEVLGRHEVDRELPVWVVLGVAPPKGERQRWLVEKVAELGVARLVPLHCARAVARPTAGACRRWRRAVVEACKQCGRNRLMDVADPLTWPQFVEGSRGAWWRLLAHPVPHAAASSGPGGEHPAGPGAERAITNAPADPLRRLMDELQQRPDQLASTPAPASVPRIVLAVGPEGGFAEQEVQLARASGFELVDLGTRTLRVETAAVALAAAVALGCRPLRHA